MVALTRSKGNDTAADYAQLKRAELSLSRGAVREAFERLRQLESRIGDITAFAMSASGFRRWEEKTSWQRLPTADREILLSRTYYLFTRLLSAIGQYSHAVSAAERSKFHTGPQAVDLAQQARLPIALARASALFEAGDLDGAESALRDLRHAENGATSPGWRVAWFELCGRLYLSRGEFKDATACLEERRRAYAEAEVSDKPPSGATSIEPIS